MTKKTETMEDKKDRIVQLLKAGYKPSTIAKFLGMSVHDLVEMFPPVKED